MQNILKGKVEMDSMLHNFLNTYWLRPETALWRTIDVESMKDFKFASPSLDLGCGDGIFSFLRAGGRFIDSFDAFKQVGNLNEFFENVDVYDYYSPSKTEAQISQVCSTPSYMIDVGLDHKTSLLNKAKELNLYRQVIEADANRRLPFENESFQTVFSNIIYWLDNPLEVFGEIYRILKKGGACCVMLPNTIYLESSFFYSLYIQGKRKELEFLTMIDRGRITDNLKMVNTYNGWKEMINAAGLSIEACIPHLSKAMLQIWDIGLRPLFPLLKKMTLQIEEPALLEIKKEWVELFEKLGSPIVENDKLLAKGTEFGFFCFILRK